jgi:hypothetical protein
VLLIYPDTNVFFGDFAMRNRSSRDLLGALEVGSVEVRLSPVVLAEVRRQSSERVAEEIGSLRKAVRTAAHNSRADTTALDAAVDAFKVLHESFGSDPLKELLEHAACEVLDWSSVSAEALVQRELDRRPPTLLKGDQSIGLRDTVIWHDLLALAKTLEDDDSLVFVTSDSGFLDVDETKTAHLKDVLRNELEEEFLEDDVVRVEQRLDGAVREAQLYRQILSARDAKIEESAVDWIMDFTGGGSRADIWGVVSPPFEMRDASVESVNNIDLYAERDGRKVTVTASASLDLTGYMWTTEYLNDYQDDVELMAGDITDHTVEVRVEAELEVSLTMDHEDGAVEDVSVVWA